MRRRDFIALICSTTLPLPSVARAQVGKLPRVGVPHVFELFEINSSGYADEPKDAVARRAYPDFTRASGGTERLDFPQT
jgi:hypothetical protein